MFKKIFFFCRNGGQDLVLEIQRLKQVSSETLDKTEFKQPSMNPYDYLPMREVQNYQNFHGMQNYQNMNYMHTRKLPDYQNTKLTEYQNIGGLDRAPDHQHFRVPDYQNVYRAPEYMNINRGSDYVAMSKIQERHNSSDSFSDDDCKENEFSVDEGIYSLPSNLITSTPLPLMCNGYQVGFSSVYNTCTCLKMYMAKFGIHKSLTEWKQNKYKYFVVTKIFMSLLYLLLKSFNKC